MTSIFSHLAKGVQEWHQERRDSIVMTAQLCDSHAVQMTIRKTFVHLANAAA